MTTTAKTELLKALRATAVSAAAPAETSECLGRLLELTNIAAADVASTVVLIHPVGGSLFCYRPLAANLQMHGVRVVGIEAVPSSGRRSTYAQRAADYCELLEREGIHPDLVAGWSVGGLIAWEMTALLPDTPAFLIDSTWPAKPQPEPEARELAEWFESDLIGAGKSAADTRTVNPLHAAPGDPERYYFEIFSELATEFNRHRPTRLRSEVSMVCGPDTDAEMWRDLGPRAIEVIRTEFGHYSFLTDQHAVSIVTGAIEGSIGVGNAT